LLEERVILPNIANAVGAATRVIGALANGEKVMASLPTVGARRLICGSCKENDVDSGQCRACTCLIRLKTLLKTETCPQGRWN
jgi:hypothetical protein